MTDQEIIKKQRYGDMVEVAKILDVTPAVVEKSLKRQASKRYPDTILVLRRIIEARESLRVEVQKELSCK